MDRPHAESVKTFRGASVRDATALCLTGGVASALTCSSSTVVSSMSVESVPVEDGAIGEISATVL